MYWIWRPTCPVLVLGPKLSIQGGVTPMIVICEECGKKYRVEIDKIKGKKASFRCVSCNYVTIFSKPEANPGIEDIEEYNLSDLQDDNFIEEIQNGSNELDYNSAEPLDIPSEYDDEESSPQRKVGIRGKMLIIVMVIPMIITFLTMLPTWNYVLKAVDLIIAEAAESEIEVAKNQINQTASTIAKQVEFYMINHPELTPDVAPHDEQLKNILLQHSLMVDNAGLYLRYSSQNPGIFLISRDESLLGREVKSIMVKGVLGNAQYDELGKIIPVGPEGEYREAMGFFLSKDENGNLKEKIMALAPIPQSPFGVIVTADTEDFMLPVKILEQRIRNLIAGARNIVAGVLGGTLIIIVSLILFYVSTITGKIKSLTDVANRISVGELEAQIEVRSNDEIGELADAVSRMQDSIRLSIARLRRRN
jgi:HAMP domain-containing protein